MDVLEKYKKAWDNQPEDEQKISSKEIYKMAKSQSSSIVKWIFIIGILEFVFWLIVNLSIPDSFYQIYEDLNLTTFITVFNVLHTIIIIGFLVLFYKNYKSVSLTDNTRKLIKNIFRVRKTVKNYVKYNIGIVFLISIIVNAIMFSDTEKFQKIMNPNNIAMDVSQLLTVTIISQILAIGIIVILLWLFYKLVYGILLKKLVRNYNELVKLDSTN